MNDLEWPWAAISWQNPFSASNSWIRAFECQKSYNLCDTAVFCALHDRLARLGRHAQLTRCFSAVAELLVSKLICHPSWFDVQLLCLKFQTNPTSFYWITAICFGGYFLLGHSVFQFLQCFNSVLLRGSFFLFTACIVAHFILPVTNVSVFFQGLKRINQPVFIVSGCSARESQLKCIKIKKYTV